MTERLDLQRKPSKLHARKNSRWYQRGYATLPHRVWGDALPTPDPTLTSLVPNTSVVNVQQLVQINGTNFMPYSTVQVDSVDYQTTYVSSTRLTYTFTPLTVGVKQVIINNDPDDAPGHEASSPLPYTVTATAGEEPEPDQVSHPENFTIAEIEAWVDAHADLADEVLTHELSRPAPRVTLVDWLEGFISHRDEGTIP
jgi:hypothetical protein